MRETIELVVQVNGKVRDRFDAAAGLSEDELVELAKASPTRAGAPRRRAGAQAIVVPRQARELRRRLSLL